MNRYALRMETADGTLEDAYQLVPNKRLAVRYAKSMAKQTVCQDVVRIWVDDTRTELGVASFETKFA